MRIKLNWKAQYVMCANLLFASCITTWWTFHFSFFFIIFTNFPVYLFLLILYFICVVGLLLVYLVAVVVMLVRVFLFLGSDNMRIHGKMHADSLMQTVVYLKNSSNNDEMLHIFYVPSIIFIYSEMHIIDTRWWKIHGACVG